MVVVAIVLVVCLLLGVAWVGVTVKVLRRVWKRPQNAPLLTKLLASVVVASALYGALGTLLGMAKGFSVLGQERAVDPSPKARILAEGIAQSMNCAALGLALWIPSVIAVFVVTRGSKTDPH